VLQAISFLPRLRKKLERAAIRSAAAFAFAFASSTLAAAQQEPPAPVFREKQAPALDNAAQTLFEPPWFKEDPPADAQRPDLPDAPSRPPLQARRLSFEERLQIYRRSILGVQSLVNPALGAALGQARDEPPEWGQGASGFGTRLASGYGRLVTYRTLRFGIAALDHEDPRFIPSNETGFWRRFRSASVGYVFVPTDGGTRIPAYSRFAGVYGAAFIANAWYPESRANAGHALMRGSTALTAGYAWHIFREFWPDIKKAIHHQKDEE
jgi:hypothetical protein